MSLTKVLVNRTFARSHIKTIINTCLAAVLSIGVSSSLMGAEKGLVSSMTAKELRTILESDGYSAFSITDNGNLKGKIDGIPYVVFIAENNKSIQFWYGVSCGGATLSKVNEWNTSKKFSKAYVDADGDPNMELDLDLSGGVSKERVLDFFGTSFVSLKTFRSEFCNL